jgi:UDP-glucose 4-epimerase
VEKLLLNNYEIIVLDNLSTGRLDNIKNFLDRIKFINCDLSKKGEWQEEFSGANYVFHIAALADIVPSIQKPENYFQSNVIGTFNVLEASKKANLNKLIYTASSSCYGIPNHFPTKEDADIKPEYPYALTKRLGEELVMHWSKLFDIPSISLRFFNVYGPKSRTSGTYGAVFGVFLAQKLANKPFTVVGDGEQTRDFTFVSDIVDAILAVSKSKQSSKIYNVGSGKTVSVNKIVDLLEGEKVYIPKRPGEPDCTFADIDKIINEIGWQPKISIEEGIKHLIKDIDYWKSAPVWTPEKIAIETEDWFKFIK